MRVLITWATKMGGTEGIARQLASVLLGAGFEVVATPAPKVHGLASYDAVIVGGALYANRWPRAARSFVARNASSLRARPVWFFSSGPLDDSADRTIIPPTHEVTVMMERIGALGHMTFGGRLSEDAKGFPASAMAKKHHGDFRDHARIEAWAKELSDSLPFAQPGVALDHPGRALWRWPLYGALGWASCSVIMFALQWLTPMNVALVLHALAVPVLFALLSQRYFRVRGARAPLATALVFSGVVALLHVTAVARGLLHGLVVFTSVVGTWLPIALIFLVTWLTGTIMAMGPMAQRPTDDSKRGRDAAPGSGLSTST